MTSSPYEEIFKKLNDSQVRYLTVGGFAVVLHGHLRTTSDIDLVLSLDKENTLSAIQVLESLGFRPRPPVPFKDFSDENRRKQWISEKGLTVFSIFSAKFPGMEIDLFVEEPFDFDVYYKRSEKVKLFTTFAQVISVDDLIEMKRKVGRPLDLEDVKVLESNREQK